MPTAAHCPYMSIAPLAKNVPVSPTFRAACIAYTERVRLLSGFLKDVSSSITKKSNDQSLTSFTHSRLTILYGLLLSCSAARLFLGVPLTIAQRSAISFHPHFSASCFHVFSATRLGATIHTLAGCASRMYDHTAAVLPSPISTDRMQLAWVAMNCAARCWYSCSSISEG